VLLSGLVPQQLKNLLNKKIAFLRQLPQLALIKINHHSAANFGEVNYER